MANENLSFQVDFQTQTRTGRHHSHEQHEKMDWVSPQQLPTVILSQPEGFSHPPV